MAIEPAVAQDFERSLMRLLSALGEDPDRDGLQKTPSRVVKTFVERMAGYQENPAEILGTTFELKHDQVVVLRDIEYVSTCEHHLLPFDGKASVAYLPSNGKVVGLSKLARLVECYARRLQIQERLTTQIAEAIQSQLSPLGVAVILIGRHQCMTCRGVKQKNASMITSVMLGRFRENPATRSELLALLSV